MFVQALFQLKSFGRAAMSFRIAVVPSPEESHLVSFLKTKVAEIMCLSPAGLQPSPDGL